MSNQLLCFIICWIILAVINSFIIDDLFNINIKKKPIQFILTAIATPLVFIFGPPIVLLFFLFRIRYIKKEELFFIKSEILRGKKKY